MAVDAATQGGCHRVAWDRKGPSGSGKGHGFPPKQTGLIGDVHAFIAVV